MRQAYKLAGASPRKQTHVKLLLMGLYLVSSGIGICLVPETFRNISIYGVAYRPLSVEVPPVKLRAIWRSDSCSKPLQHLLEILRTKATASGKDL